jgi:xylan 1,4-beta-xylosidase
VARGEARLQHYRIDETHSNAFAAWKRMGSPIAPNEAQYAELEAAGQLARLEGPATVRIESGQATVPVVLPRQAVSLLVFEW